MFKVGDEVFIRQHTKEEKDVYRLAWVPEMDEFEGNRCIVTKVRSSGNYTVRYGIYQYNFIPSSLIATVNPHCDQF